MLLPQHELLQVPVLALCLPPQQMEESQLEELIVSGLQLGLLWAPISVAQEHLGRRRFWKRENRS